MYIHICVCVFVYVCTHVNSSFDTMSGLEIRAPLNFPAAPSNFCREPKDVLVSIHNTFRWLLKMQLGSLEKNLISSPAHRLTALRSSDVWLDIHRFYK